MADQDVRADARNQGHAPRNQSQESVLDEKVNIEAPIVDEGGSVEGVASGSQKQSARRGADASGAAGREEIGVEESTDPGGTDIGPTNLSGTQSATEVPQRLGVGESLQESAVEDSRD
ncbi:MAG TPA: hypothetical protein VFB38_19175 [Chthonomonadaceae bacterium]|nr:hypothetical protein [Chthonomonadaceae bacterium]